MTSSRLLTNWGGSPPPSRGDHAGDLRNGLTVVFNGIQQKRHDRLAFTFDDAIDRAVSMCEEFFRDKGCAVASYQHEAVRCIQRGEFAEVDDLRDIGEIIAGEGYDIRLPVIEEAGEVFVGSDLEIEQTHFVSGPADHLGNQFEPQRLQAKKDFG